MRLRALKLEASY